MKKFLSLIMVIIIISCTVLTSFAQKIAENDSEGMQLLNKSLNIYDVIAGNCEHITINEKSKQNAVPIIANAVTTEYNMRSVSNGTYYFNNRGDGKFLNKNGTSNVNGQSGKLSNLGNSIKWVVTNYNNTYCLIKPYSDTTKCLAGATSTTSSAVSIISTPSIVTDRCLWEIYVATGGGCIVKNKLSGRVLFCYNGAVSTRVDSSSNYDYEVWRIASDTYYTTSNELSSISFSTLNEVVTQSKSPSVSTKNPSSALWSTYSDFNYSTNSTAITINNSMHKITGNYVTNCSVSAIHKVTGISTTFIVRITALQIYITNTTPGYNADGTVARDMVYADKTYQQLNSINTVLGSLAVEYNQPPASNPNFPPQGPDALKHYMRQLPDLFASGNSSMKNVASAMVEHFLDGTGTDYSNATLTNTVKNHTNTTSLINAVKNRITTAAGNYSGDLYSATSNNYFYNSLSSVPLPAYNTSADLLNGLKLCINGIWGYSVDVTSFMLSGNQFTCNLTFHIFDHFGLDDGDISQSSWYSDFLGYTAQFGSWFVLQRYVNTNGLYRPFITRMDFSETFSGSIS